MQEHKHLYLIGIGGVGMVWLADWALSQGWQVSGSDFVSSAPTERLQNAGATIHYGIDPAQIPADITDCVITSAITVNSPSYPEFKECERRGISIEKRAVWVGNITRRMRTIAVAGTHGKTTTTAMIGWILDYAGLDPTVFVGGSLAVWGGKTKIGKGGWLVLEADEFDRSFHHFSAEIAVLLNVEADHLDYYTKGLPEIEHSFRRFLRNLPHREGIVVAYGKNASLRKICRGFAYHIHWYNEENLWPGVHLQIPGIHNLLNATAAARVAHEIGVPHKDIKEALATFPGVGRRFEHLGVWNKAELYDDYAHHPSEIRATLQGLRQRFPDKNSTVVFQPHQKARTQNLLTEFGRAFDKNAPDRLIIAPIYQVAGREEDIPVTNHNVAEEIAKKKSALLVEVPDSELELQELVVKASQGSDVVLVMGAGNIRTMIERWRHE